MLYQTQNPHGGDLSPQVKLDFSVNINPLGTPGSVMEAMRNALENAAAYPDPFCREAVRAIASHENVPEEYILCGNGAAELICTYCAAAGAKTALIPVPTFSEYEAALRVNGCEVYHFILDEKKDFLPDGSFLEKIKQIRSDVIFLCHPNNPTGKLIPEEILRGAIELCGELDIRLFVDECFLDFTENGTDAKSFLEGHRGLFILKALTKFYALAGIRFGYGLTSDQDLLRKMSSLVQPWNVSGIAQATVPAAFNEKDYPEQTRDLITRERGWLSEELRKFGFFVCGSDANFILFRGPDQLREALLRDGIAIRGCANFSGLGPGWFRTAVRNHEENAALIGAIRHVMEEQIP